jgi:hypothetical protein
VELFGEIGGQVVVALPAEGIEPDPTGSEVDVRRIGTVGGDELLGIPLAELADAYEGRQRAAPEARLLRAAEPGATRQPAAKRPTIGATAAAHRRVGLQAHSKGPQ